MAKSSSEHCEFNSDDVEVIEKKTVFKGYFQIDQYSVRHRIHEGGWSKPVSREIFERGHVSAMLLFDPQKDIVVMVEQFRTGSYAAGYNPWLVEIPAGIIESGQTALDVAIRETEEETGCQAKRVEFIADYLVTPGGSTESVHLYCIEVDSDEATEFAGLEDEGEHIRVLKVSSKDVFDMLDCGQIHNGMSIIAIQWLKLHHYELRKKWC